nr:hypothetical protein [Tanacetum cinerariifolium]GEZ59117.1 hypothetical protein [Tanacetum cinerariifolium]
MLKVAKLSEEPEQYLIPPSKKRTKKRIPPSFKPKSPNKIMVILLKKQVVETQHAEVTMATADGTKSLVASKLEEEQGNQALAAEAEKVTSLKTLNFARLTHPCMKIDPYQNVEEEIKDTGFVAMEEVTFEQIMDEVDAKTQGAQEIDESPYDTELEIKFIKSYQDDTISSSLLRFVSDDDLASIFDFETQDSIDHVSKEAHLLKPKEQKSLFKNSSISCLQPLPQSSLLLLQERQLLPELNLKGKAKKVKMMEEYNHLISFIADPLPITKIIYVVNTNKEATMKVTRGDNPLNLIVYPNFRLRTMGFSEWQEVHALVSKKNEKSNDMLLQSLRAKFQWVINQSKKLGLFPPPALETSGMTTKDKKKNMTEFLKEVFITKNITVDEMQRNLIPPFRVMPIKGIVINETESGIFFMNKNTDIAF